MQHAVKSKVLAAMLSVMIAVTFMPFYLWQTTEASHASIITSTDAMVYNYDSNCIAKSGTFKEVYEYATGDMPANNDIRILRNVKIDADDVSEISDVSLTGYQLGTEDDNYVEGDDWPKYKVKRVISATRDSQITFDETVTFGTNSDEYTINLSTNAGGSMLVEKKSLEQAQELAPYNLNEYAAVYDGDIYLGLAAIRDAYEQQLTYETKEQRHNHPIVVYNSESLTDVPGGVVIFNASGKDIMINGEPVSDDSFNELGYDNMYEVIFDARGGILDNGKEKKKVYVKKEVSEEAESPLIDIGEIFSNDGNTVEEPEAPTKDGYIFDGWFTNPNVKYTMEIEIGTHSTTVEADVLIGANGDLDVVTDGPGVDIDLDALIGTKAHITYDAGKGKYFIITADGDVLPATALDSNLYDFSQPVTSNMTLYAHWLEAPKTYNVSFNLNDGKAYKGENVVKLEDQKVVSGDYATNPLKLEDASGNAIIDEFKKEDGSTFGGWYHNGEKWNFVENPVKENIELEAKWLSEAEDDEYDVTFDLNGGEVSGDSIPKQTLGAGNKVEEPNVEPTKTGYTFDGWYNGFRKWDFNTMFVEKDMTLVAKWKAEEYTVIFRTQGQGNEGSIAPIKVKAGQYIGTVKNPVLTEEGWTFGGWFDNQDCRGTKLNLKNVTPEGLAETGSKTIELYAKWTQNEYSVEFKNAEMDPIKALSGEPFVKPENPTKKNYKFGGYFTDKEMTSEYDWRTPATANITLWIKWIAASQDDEHTVYFKLNGGKITQNIVKEYDLEGLIELAENEGRELNAFYLANEDFAEYITFAKGVSSDAKNGIISDLRNAIKFINDNYSKQVGGMVNPDNVKAHKAGATNQIKTALKTSETVVSDENFTETVETGNYVDDPGNPTRSGYEFLYWEDEATGDKFSFNRTPINENTTLVAKWTEKALVTIYADNEGNNTRILFKAYVVKGKAIIEAEDAGYKLEAKLYDTTYDEDNPIPSFFKNGKFNVNEITQLMESLRPGYNFLGFYTKEGESFDLGQAINNDMSLYGHWTTKPVAVFHDAKAGGTPVAYLTLDKSRALTAFEIYGARTGAEAIETLPEYLKMWKLEMSSEDHKDRFPALRDGNYSLNDALYQYGRTEVKKHEEEGIYSHMSRKGIFAKEGYEFEGFYTDENCTEAWDSKSAIDGSMDIYLNYEPIEYKIIFDRGEPTAEVIEGETLDDGALNYDNSWASGKKTYTQTVKYGTKDTLIPCKYEREGFLFDGWKLFNIDEHTGRGHGIDSYVDEAIINANIDEIQENIVEAVEGLYAKDQFANYVFVAQWKPIKYQVTYHANGGKGADGKEFSEVLTYNEKDVDEDGWNPKGFSTAANKFMNKGFHFAGWSREADGAVEFAGSEHHNYHPDGTTYPDWNDKEKRKTFEKGHKDYHPCAEYDGKVKLEALVDGGLKYKDTNLTTTPGENVDLYAQWVPCDNYAYTVTTYIAVPEQDREVIAKGEPEDLQTYAKKHHHDVNDDIIEIEDEQRGDDVYIKIVELKTGKTGEEVTAENIFGDDLDEVLSTEDLTIELSAEGYVDKCKAWKAYRDGNIKNIDVYEKAYAKRARIPVAVQEDPETYNLVYNGEAQELIKPGKTDDGEFVYAILPNELGAPDFEPDWDKVEWLEPGVIPTAVNAGEYTIAYKIIGDENHQDSEPRLIKGFATISQKKVTFDWGKTSFNYDGTYHVPTATAVGVVPGDTCTVKVDGAQKNIGKGYNAEIAGLSNDNYVQDLNSDIFTKFDIVSSFLLAKATPKGSKKIKVTWTGVSGATRYVVYGINCGKATVYKYNRSTGAGTMSINVSKAGGKKIKAHKPYKFYVQAYADNTLIAQSNTMHCIAAKTKGKKYANPTGISAKTKTVVVGTNGIGGVAAKYKVAKKKKILGTDHVKPYRYVTSDPGIATVDSKGTVKAVHAGTCTVYTQTVNGMWCGTTVNVK